MLTFAGRQRTSTPREQGFLLLQEVLFLQEAGQFAMIKVKGVAYKQDSVVLNLMCKDCPWMNVTDSVLRKSVYLTARSL